MGGLTPNLRRHSRDPIMSKLHILRTTIVLLGVCGCAQQPTGSGPLPLPTTQTASTDWTVAVQPDGSLGQDDDGDGVTLEDRARAVLGNKALRGTLPDNELNQDLLFKFLLSEIAAQRGDLQFAAQGYLDMARKTRDPRLAKRATEIAAYGRLQAQALEAARLWLELDKDNPQARQTLAALLVSSNKLSEAKPLLEPLITAAGNVSAAFMQLNSLLGKHTDGNAVLAIVRELAKGYPQLPEAHFAVAQAAFSAGKYDEASAQIKQALDIKPDWEAGALFNAQLLQQRDSNAKAIEYLQQFLRTYPKSREVRASYARLLINSKQLKEARSEYQLLLEDQP